MANITKKEVGFLAGGFAIGIIVMGIMVWTMMPGMMLVEHKSKLGFEETIHELSKAAIEHGWAVPKVYDLQGNLKKEGYENATKMKILSICQPHHAYKILEHDENKKVTAMMPCRIGVYENSKGEVYITQMNIGLMSKMFGGTIESVMSDVAEEEHEMFKHIYEN